MIPASDPDPESDLQHFGNYWSRNRKKQNHNTYTEAKADETQEVEQRAQQAAQAGADHCTLCSISCVTSTLASVYWAVKIFG